MDKYHDKLKLYILFIFMIFIIFNELSSINNYNKYMNIIPKTNIYGKANFNIKDLLKSRELFINDSNLTNEYIKFVRPLKNNTIYSYSKKFNIKFYENYFGNRQYQINYNEFAKICVDEKIINSTKIKLYHKPLVSIIIATYNKEDILIKSIRSIQNQSIKNIEIIIVDDCSKDNTKKYYKYLLNSDKRIRIFYHLKNMGLWRTRIDGFLYSRGEYVIHFDAADMYADNLVLEDAYNVAKKYNLDSVKMVFIISLNNFSQNNLGNFNFKENFTIIAYGDNITKYNDEIFRAGHIWTRLTRTNVFLKGLYSLSDGVLNIYKNMWDDLWWNRLANINSNNLLILKRYAYLYNRDGITEGIVRIDSEKQKDKV